MKKWLAALAVVLVLLLGYGVAGPYLAIRGIHSAIEARDPNKLEPSSISDAAREHPRQGREAVAASATRRPAASSATTSAAP